MSEYEITANAPPTSAGTKGGKNKYPFLKMQIGESFFVPDTDARRGNVQSAAHYYKRKYSLEFSVEARFEDMEIDGEIQAVKGVRVERNL